MQTRSSSSSSLDHRREAQLQIVDVALSRGKILPAVNRPRSSRNSSVDKYFTEPGTRVYEGSRNKQDRRSVEHASRGFRLPKGWSVEEVPRKSSYHIDKYYVERSTGKRFRSLASVERYLNEGKNPKDQQLMLLEYHQIHHSHSKDFSLPDGWIIEEKQRRYSSQIDRSYIEPGTGNKFRSLVAVERYLQSIGNNKPLAVTRNVLDPNPPKEVKWVLTGPGGNMFTANVEGSEVSSSVKQTWSEAFVTIIQDRS